MVETRATVVSTGNREIDNNMGGGGSQPAPITKTVGDDDSSRCNFEGATIIVEEGAEFKPCSGDDFAASP